MSTKTMGSFEIQPMGSSGKILVTTTETLPMNKEMLGNSTKFGAKTSIGAASCTPNTIWCPGRAPKRTSRSRVFPESLLYNSPDCSANQRRNGQMCPMVDCGEQWTMDNTEVRSQNCKVKTHRTVRCATGLPGAARGQTTSMVNCSKPQRSADMARIGQWTVSCPVHHRTVRCDHRQQW
jgi:hypothetical protein